MLVDRLTLKDNKVVAEEPLLTGLLTDTAGMVITETAPPTSSLLKIVPE